MAPKVGGTPPGTAHDYAIPFASVSQLLATYKDRDAAKIALVDVTQQKSITFGQLHDWANRIANWLVAKGINKGDRIALLSEERLEKLILWMGIWRAGAVCCPINVEMNIAYVAEILGHLDCKLALSDADLDIAQMTDGVDIESLSFTDWSNDLPGDANGTNLFARIAPVAAMPECDRNYVETDDATIFCTSGTTDKPKNFLIDHLAHWSFGLSSIDQLGLTEDDKTLEFRSFGWNSAQGLSLMPWLATGCTLHFARRFSHSQFFEWIKQYEITFSAHSDRHQHAARPADRGYRQGRAVTAADELVHRAAHPRALAAVRRHLRHQSAAVFWLLGRRLGVRQPALRQKVRHGRSARQASGIPAGR
jgi:acyl-coenzyme A synthetase/AMP-(fatty) acid ligase